ncbi:hypothetical protein GETHLI_30400 [Geothrix limicola]|uniref:ABC transporter substrate-binding protein n=1 Tax=Geothrix limicola TaxID=2927978 RepID=A0ABQ5QJ03_9BACT|nr:hypothetical protein [Geothrix limicola]GLH74538.1 hypothetical protein GETHLI_30400 [Geothrix limicola]
MTFLVGIDDTDTLDTPGTNHLARLIASRLPEGFRCRSILRHQLFFDPRVPYTSHNGSASLRIETDGWADDQADVQARAFDQIVACFRREMRDWFVPGSDPGLCVTSLPVPDSIHAYALRCQHEVIKQTEARELAAREGLFLEGLGGTEDGVIGALAAVGHASGGNDGRVIHLDGWKLEDPLRGLVALPQILAEGVDEVRERATGLAVTTGWVELRKKLRPNMVQGRVVLFVEAAESDATPSPLWRALKVT